MSTSREFVQLRVFVQRSVRPIFNTVAAETAVAHTCTPSVCALHRRQEAAHLTFKRISLMFLNQGA